MWVFLASLPLAMKRTLTGAASGAASAAARSARAPPATFPAALEALTALARSRKATSSRPTPLHAALALAPSAASVQQALHASFLRGNLVPNAATSTLVVRALLRGGGGSSAEGAQPPEALQGALAALVNPRLRLPPSGAAFGALLRAAPREAGSTLPADIVRAAAGRGAPAGSTAFTVHSVAALAGVGSFAAAAAQLQRRATGASRSGARRAAHALLHALAHAPPALAPWGLSAARLQWLREEALPLLTTPSGVKLRARLAPVLEAARAAAAAGAAAAPAAPAGGAGEPAAAPGGEAAGGAAAAGPTPQQ